MPNARRRQKKTEKRQRIATLKDLRETVTGHVIRPGEDEWLPGVPAFHEGSPAGLTGVWHELWHSQRSDDSPPRPSQPLPPGWEYIWNPVQDEWVPVDLGTSTGGGTDPYQQSLLDRRLALDQQELELRERLQQLANDADVAIAEGNRQSAERIENQKRYIEALQLQYAQKRDTLDRQLQQYQLATSTRGQDITQRGQSIDAQIAQNQQRIDQYRAEVQAAQISGDQAAQRDAEARLRSAQQQAAILDAFSATLSGSAQQLQAQTVGGQQLGALAGLEQQRQQDLIRLSQDPSDFMGLLNSLGQGRNFLQQLAAGQPVTGQSATTGIAPLDFGTLEQLWGQIGQTPVFNQAAGAATALGGFRPPAAPTAQELLAQGPGPISGAPQMPGAPGLLTGTPPPVPGLGPEAVLDPAQQAMFLEFRAAAPHIPIDIALALARDPAAFRQLFAGLGGSPPGTTPPPPPGTLPPPQPGTPPLTPDAERAFLNDFFSRWPNVTSRDAALAAQFGLNALSNIILTISAGTPPTQQTLQSAFQSLFGQGQGSYDIDDIGRWIQLIGGGAPPASSLPPGVPPGYVPIDGGRGGYVPPGMPPPDAPVPKDPNSPDWQLWISRGWIPPTAQTARAAQTAGLPAGAPETPALPPGGEAQAAGGVQSFVDLPRSGPGSVGEQIAAIFAPGGGMGTFDQRLAGSVGADILSRPAGPPGENQLWDYFRYMEEQLPGIWDFMARGRQGTPPPGVSLDPVHGTIQIDPELNFQSFDPTMAPGTYLDMSRRVREAAQQQGLTLPDAGPLVRAGVGATERMAQLLLDLGLDAGAIPANDPRLLEAFLALGGTPGSPIPYKTGIQKVGATPGITGSPYIGNPIPYKTGGLPSIPLSPQLAAPKIAPELNLKTIAPNLNLKRFAGGGGFMVREPSVLLGLRSGRPLATMGEPTTRYPRGIPELIRPVAGGLQIDPPKRFDLGGKMDFDDELRDDLRRLSVVDVAPPAAVAPTPAPPPPVTPFDARTPPLQGTSPTAMDSGSLLRRLLSLSPSSYYNLLPSEQDVLFSIGRSLGMPEADARASILRSFPAEINPGRILTSGF